MKRSVAAPNEDSFYQRSEEYTEKALEKKSVALGYTFDPVSYTHLDVYKRQECHSAALRHNEAAFQKNDSRYGNNGR